MKSQDFKLHDYQIEARDDLAAALRKLLNGGTRQQLILIDVLDEMHPTLEQNFWRMVRDTAAHYSTVPDNYYDQRNVASQKFVKHIAEYDGHLPLI